jgi:hypothetical protein
MSPVDIEGDRLAFDEFSVRCRQVGTMHEYIARAIVARQEAVAFRVVEELDVACDCHGWLLFKLLTRVVVKIGGIRSAQFKFAIFAGSATRYRITSPKMDAARIVLALIAGRVVFVHDLPLRKHPSPRRKDNGPHDNQIPARCIESYAHQKWIDVEVVPEFQFADLMLFKVVVVAKWKRPFVRRFLSCAAALPVRRALASDVSGLAAGFERATATWQLPYLFQINRVSFSYLFQIQLSRCVEGAFEQLAGRGDGGKALGSVVRHVWLDWLPWLSIVLLGFYGH